LIASIALRGALQLLGVRFTDAGEPPERGKRKKAGELPDEAARKRLTEVHSNAFTARRMVTRFIKRTK